MLDLELRVFHLPNLLLTRENIELEKVGGPGQKKILMEPTPVEYLKTPRVHEMIGLQRAFVSLRTLTCNSQAQQL
jgi:hypothetical protein